MFFQLKTLNECFFIIITHLFIYLLILSAWGSTYCRRIWDIHIMSHTSFHLNVREIICIVSRRLTCQVWCSAIQTDANSVCFDVYPCFKLNSSPLHGSQTARRVPAQPLFIVGFPSMRNHVFQDTFRTLEGLTHSQVLCVIGIWLYAAKPCAKQGLYIQDIVV